ncbi:hypothetical protein ACIBI9_52445 [Nonomuraea sp. NPDC050451]|uniref:hypothetical protein n=1 Tax=Nonomuraea sp. NPDC050451 TaxID=3364364 RepID=UPI00378ABD75
MIVWLNGTFGAGKTSTARELVPLVPGARYFDPEQVGFMLQTVLIEEYWQEISAGLRDAGIPVHLFVLHTDQETLTRRIEAADDVPARKWRLEHLPAYAGAFPWLSREGQVVDTTLQPPAEVARSIADRLG